MSKEKLEARAKEIESILTQEELDILNLKGWDFKDSYAPILKERRIIIRDLVDKGYKPAEMGYLLGVSYVAIYYQLKKSM
jgi:hypothetical protein